MAALASMALTTVLLWVLIPILRRKKMGQKILNIGPSWHKEKEGTPTMGGLCFILSACVICSLFSILFLHSYNEIISIVTAVVYSVLCGLIGITDDVCKLTKKQNEGLSASQKYLLQLAASAVFLIAAKRFGIISETISLPFTDKALSLGAWYYPLALLFLSGFNNAVNLTDGIDGLCASVTASVMIAFCARAIYLQKEGESLFSTVIFGAMLGFLVFNLHPAKVFMGDTGSLFLGGAVSASAIISNDPLILFLIGIVYLIEAASVIIQVLYFKLTGKRFFKMAPFHHHLEKSGWSENKIALSAVILTLLASAATFIG